MWQPIILGTIIIAWAGATPKWDLNWQNSNHRPDRHYQSSLHRQIYTGSDFEKDEWICRNTKSGETISIQSELQQQEGEPDELGSRDKFIFGRHHPHHHHYHHHHGWNLIHGPRGHGRHRDSHEENDEFDDTKKHGDYHDSGENTPEPKSSYTTDWPRMTQNQPQMTTDEQQGTESASPWDTFLSVTPSSNTGGVGIIDVRIGSSSEE